MTARRRFTIFLTAALILASCQNPESKPALVAPASRDDLTPRFARKDLFGVWEVVDYYQNGLATFETRPNLKYCFNDDCAYPALPPDIINDSIEGSTDWFIVKNLLIFEGSMGTGQEVFYIEKLTDDTLVLRTSAVSKMTLNRIRRTYHGKTPVLKIKKLPVRGIPQHPR